MAIDNDSFIDSNNDNNALVVVIRSHPKFLCIVRGIIGQIGEVYELSNTEIADIKHGIDEACSNIIKHAYGGNKNKKIVIRFSLSPSNIKIIIEDSGKKINLNELKGRDLDNLKPGGLGLHIIAKAFDSVTYDETKKKGNRLELIRSLSKK
ncbi:anti-sigma regulatory factor, serine/threonine protein kinase [Candidatus Magnetoovum chiemensis]|nr:anti-sigma regulatory factor, serine/threonine protein kinase [Candidatus Magnetoovum chiemensis]